MLFSISADKMLEGTFNSFNPIHPHDDVKENHLVSHNNKNLEIALKN